MALDQFQGATITFQSGFFAQITDVRHVGLQREKIPTSHSGTTGAHTGIMSNLYHPGRFIIQGFYDNTKSFVTPLTAASETVTVTKLATGQSTGGTVAGTAAMGEFEWGGPVDGTPEARMFTATIEILDDITFVAGS